MTASQSDRSTTFVLTLVGDDRQPREGSTYPRTPRNRETYCWNRCWWGVCRGSGAGLSPPQLRAEAALPKFSCAVECGAREASRMRNGNGASRSDRKFFRRVQKHATHPWSHIVLDEAHGAPPLAAGLLRAMQKRTPGCRCTLAFGCGCQIATCHLTDPFGCRCMLVPEHHAVLTADWVVRPETRMTV